MNEVQNNDMMYDDSRIFSDRLLYVNKAIPSFHDVILGKTKLYFRPSVNSYVYNGLEFKRDKNGNDLWYDELGRLVYRLSSEGKESYYLHDNKNRLVYENYIGLMEIKRYYRKDTIEEKIKFSNGVSKTVTYDRRHNQLQKAVYNAKSLYHIHKNY